MKMNINGFPRYVASDTEKFQFWVCEGENTVFKDTVDMPKIKKIIIYNKRATVIFWKDGTQTKVVIGKFDEYDEEKAIAVAISKKFYGSYDKFYRSLSRVKHSSNE